MRTADRPGVRPTIGTGVRLSGVAGVALLATLALTLVSCSSAHQTGSAGKPGSGPSATDYLPVKPSGSPSSESGPGALLPANATKPGTTLKLGGLAVVLIAPDTPRASLLRLRVMSIRRGWIRDLSYFNLSRATRRSTPYYVGVRFRNVGHADLGGERIPLYAVGGAQQVLPPVHIVGSFPTCHPPLPFPRPFGHGKHARGCLLYLVPHHGQLRSVQFRYGAASRPISWSVR
jgi:hypothetical protein